MTDSRRDLPSVDRLLHDPGVADLLRIAPRGAVVAAIRETLAAARTRRAGPPEDWAVEIRERLTERRRPGLRPVLNATGVVLHTNLGRAPLAPAAIRRRDRRRRRLQQPRVRSRQARGAAAAITAASCCAR